VLTKTGALLLAGVASLRIGPQGCDLLPKQKNAAQSGKYDDLHMQ
jgi:hypothetical protein